MLALTKSSRGATMVEMAILLPLLFLLISGIIDVGYALVQLGLLTQATHIGAHQASRYPKPYFTNLTGWQTLACDTGQEQTQMVALVNNATKAFLRKVGFPNVNPRVALTAIPIPSLTTPHPGFQVTVSIPRRCYICIAGSLFPTLSTSTNIMFEDLTVCS